MKTDLGGKVAIVCGATAGIGLPIAHGLAESGATVVVVSIDQPGIETTVADIKANGGKAIGKYADLLNVESVKAMVNESVAELGRVDIMINSSGGGAASVGSKFTGPFIEIDPEIYDLAMKRFLLVKLYGINAVLPHMKEQGYGKIVNVTSDAGRTPTPKESMIGSGSAGLILATKTIAKECSRWGIRVNTVGVTLVPDTEANAMVFASSVANVFEKVAKQAKLGLPLRQDVANLVQFLASPESDGITGQTVSINGGISFPG